MTCNKVKNNLFPQFRRAKMKETLTLNNNGHIFSTIFIHKKWKTRFLYLPKCVSVEICLLIINFYLKNVIFRQRRFLQNGEIEVRFFHFSGKWIIKLIDFIQQTYSRSSDANLSFSHSEFSKLQTYSFIIIMRKSDYRFFQPKNPHKTS